MTQRIDFRMCREKFYHPPKSLQPQSVIPTIPLQRFPLAATKLALIPRSKFIARQTVTQNLTGDIPDADRIELLFSLPDELGKMSAAGMIGVHGQNFQPLAGDSAESVDPERRSESKIARPERGADGIGFEWA